MNSKGMEISEVLSILFHILLHTFRRMRLKYESYTFERHLILVIQVATLNYKSLIENIFDGNTLK